MTPSEVVADAWKKIGDRQIRPLGRRVIVRTKAPEQMYKGIIWLPPKEWTLYGQSVHKGLVEATVLAVGPGASKVHHISVGDHIAFRRLDFGWLYQIGDTNDRIGFVDSKDIVGFVKTE